MDKDAKSMPIVSVVIPTYNCEKSIGKIVESIFQQSYQNIEIIISDNCSTDATWEKAQDLEARYPSVRVFQNKKNLGAIKNIETLFNIANGDLIWLRPCGDDYSTNYLECCVDAHMSDASIALTVPRILMYINEQIVYEINYDDKLSRSLRDPLREFPTVGFYGVYKKSYIKECMPFEQMYGSDLLFVHKLFTLGKVTFVDRCNFAFESRRQRNTRNQDTLFYFGHDIPPSSLPPGLVLTSARIFHTSSSKLGLWSKFSVSSSILWHFIKEKMVIFLTKSLVYPVRNPNLYRSICTTLFNVTLKEDYVSVIDEEVYWNSEIRPRLRIRHV